MKVRLHLFKRAGLFVALFTLGNFGFVKDAHASVLSLQAMMNASLGSNFFAPINGLPSSAPLNAVMTVPVIPVIAPPSAAVGLALGAPANQPAPFAVSTPNMAFAAFGLGGPKATSLGGFSSFGFHSVAGSTTAPVSVGPPAAAPTFNPVPAFTAAPTLDPEPASIFLFASGLIAVGAFGRKRMVSR